MTIMYAKILAAIMYKNVLERDHFFFRPTIIDPTVIPINNPIK